VLVSTKHDIFLSYAWGKDRVHQPLAIAVQTLLTNAGYKVWMDLYCMGADVQQSMKQGIADSSVAVILANPEYMDRPNCRAEWEAIVSSGMPFQVVNVHSSSPFEWCSETRTFYKQVLNPEQCLFVDMQSCASKPSGPGGCPSDALYERLQGESHMPHLLKLVGEKLQGKGTVANIKLTGSVGAEIIPLLTNEVGGMKPGMSAGTGAPARAAPIDHDGHPSSEQPKPLQIAHLAQALADSVRTKWSLLPKFWPDPSKEVLDAALGCIGLDLRRARRIIHDGTSYPTTSGWKTLPPVG
jgi:hypothetical protein